MGVVVGCVRLEAVPIGLNEFEAYPVVVGCVRREAVQIGPHEPEAELVVVGRVPSEDVPIGPIEHEAESVVVGRVPLEGVPRGTIEEEAVHEVCDAAILDGDAGPPFKEDPCGHVEFLHPIGILIGIHIGIPYEVDVEARPDDRVAITVQGNAVCTDDDGGIEVVLGEGGVRRYDEGLNGLRGYERVFGGGEKSHLIAPNPNNDGSSNEDGKSDQNYNIAGVVRADLDLAWPLAPLNEARPITHLPTPP